MDLFCPQATPLEYLITVRRHSLLRSYSRSGRNVPEMPLHIAEGMKQKEVHEVSEFVAYVDALARDISLPGEEPAIVDFGSVQNYLGPPYERSIKIGQAAGRQ
jgi:hypothetical protein